MFVNVNSSDFQWIFISMTIFILDDNWFECDVNVFCCQQYLKNNSSILVFLWSLCCCDSILNKFHFFFNYKNQNYHHHCNNCLLWRWLTKENHRIRIDNRFFWTYLKVCLFATKWYWCWHFCQSIDRLNFRAI